MEKSHYKLVSSSHVSITQLMLPTHTNFSGKIHGGYILSLLDQVAFASASKFSGKYCVTASVDRVDFINPIEVGELVTLKAAVNYVGNSSMIVGVKVEAENIQTGKIKHCNSSYFTMVAKDENGKNATVPGLELRYEEDVRRFINCIKQIDLRKERDLHEEKYHSSSIDAKALLQKYRVLLSLKP
jgi:acyl-CoA hydrolase